jgi:membrane protease YdiL (CAAX protease family)
MFIVALALSVAQTVNIGEQPRAFIVASLEVVPFVMLAVLAYLGVTRDWGKVLAVLWLLVLIGSMALITFGYTFSALLAGPLPTAPQFSGNEPSSLLVEGGGIRMLLVVVLSFPAVIVGGLGFVPAVRRWISRFLPINPDSFVHTIALITVMVMTLLCFIPLIVLGAPPVLELINNQPSVGETIAEETSLGGLIYRLTWTIPGAVLAVGYAVRRDLRGALVRLGFVRPSFAQVAVGIGVAVVLVFAQAILGGAIDWLWSALNWPQTDNEAFGELIAFALNPLGAVVIGVTAGIGEELAVRGVLQPRLGIVLSNLFFTAGHALQYSWDALLVVFLLGLVFGVLRKRTNTTTSAIAHGVYDFILVMVSVLAPELGQ